MKKAIAFATTAILFLGAAPLTSWAQNSSMTFFITSAGPGDGANLGGLEGADAHCQSLAQAAGAENRTWRAYLSTDAENARDRIGNGPWHNAKGELIAQDLAALHSDANAINKATGLTENGEQVNGRTDNPNRHDILTGSNPDGTASEKTCENWTANGDGSAIVGHHDRMGLADDAPSKSWNSSHPSRGCSQEALRGSGGDGLLYCFAVN
jgi:hypothetical protein